MNKQQQPGKQSRGPSNSSDEVLNALNNSRRGPAQPERSYRSTDKRVQPETRGRRDEDETLARDKERAEEEGMTRHKQDITPGHEQHPKHD